MYNECVLQTLSEAELYYVMGGTDWDSIATAAWIVGGTAMCIPGAGHAVGLICCGFAAGYYLGKGVSG